jgi:hypothetical protein
MESKVTWRTKRIQTVQKWIKGEKPRTDKKKKIPPGHGCLSVVGVVCCQVEISATSWSLVQRSPTECGVSECDREASIMRRPWPTKGCCAMKKLYVHYNQSATTLKTKWCLTHLPFICQRCQNNIQGGALFTWHSMFNMLPPVSSYFCATLYILFLFKQWMVLQLCYNISCFWLGICDSSCRN